MERGLVISAQEGDHEAFSRLASIHIGRLTAIARLILHDAGAAEDAVQDALVDAWRSLPTLRDPDRFEAWLRRLLLRACADQWRQRRWVFREVVLPPEPLSVVGDAQSVAAVRDQIERGLRSLAPEQRAVLVLTYYLDLPLAEAAQLLDIPVGTMKSRLSRARAAMRAVLDADERLQPRTEVGLA